MDVFTTELYRGNPAAVVFDAADIAAESMQAIAREMNLSETCFVLPPTAPSAHYRVRFFTARGELPFAGHPTVAIAAALVGHDERWARLVPGILRQVRYRHRPRRGLAGQRWRVRVHDDAGRAIVS